VNRQDYLKGKKIERVYPVDPKRYSVGDTVVSVDGKIVGIVTEVSHDIVFLDIDSIRGDIIPQGAMPAYRRSDFIRHE
jgi:hypothetical protein